ncbi:kelch repeat-containing protein [Tahibacter caeni]|uniref:kelch repeat-containing protein n=1 Tax=Tahibacter caeni TaxID=1453545 RepID=UPI0021485E37|nr:kelch repeat-containing protein [Tahibacter caeni]
MNRPIFGRAAATAHVLAARARAQAVAFVLLVLALVAAPAAAVTNAWAPAGGLNTARYGHTATLLSSGKVLVVGGAGGAGILASAELYDPATNAWSAAGSMAAARTDHTATLLPSGKVLVTGGRNGSTRYASAELYDPATNAWAAAGDMPVSRYAHTATLLPSGKVLVVGGYNGTDRANADLYDPAANAWSAASALTNARYAHTATLLSSGKVLVAGGRAGGGPLSASAEVYDPGTNLWSPAGTPIARSSHTATLLPSGHVLVAGGMQSGAFGSTQLYDPATNAWIATSPLAIARYSHSAALLPSGKVLVAGGIDVGSGALGSAEVFDPATNAWSTVGALAALREYHTMTLLPSGQVLAAGGYDGSSRLASAELYDPAAGAWSAAGALVAGRAGHTATPLPSGKVLVAGGDSGSGYLTGAESYDPSTNTWSVAGSLAVARYRHTATLLLSGKVLVAGGSSSSGDVELYDPATNAWSVAGTLAAPRTGHTATLLASGKVLVAGGGNYLASAELYDPVTGTWSPVAPMATGRINHTATLLTSGKVLVAGGDSSGGFLTSAELYDPSTNTWSAAGTLAAARMRHTATLLPSGKVLVAGGTGGSGILATAERYDPAANTWSAAGTLAAKRYMHTATLLPSGRVLVVAGNGSGVTLASAESYDPAANAWSAAGNLAETRYWAAATLLMSGQVLVTGGATNTGPVRSNTELYDPGLAPVNALQPGLNAVGASLAENHFLSASSTGSTTAANAATATGFMPWREGSGGASNSSASNAPVFQVQRIDNGQMRFVPSWDLVATSDTSFMGVFPRFPAGPVVVRAWVNGVPSAARYSTVELAPGRPAAPTAVGGTLRATVNFTSVADSGTSPVTSYTAIAWPGGASASCTAPCTSTVFSSLDPGSYTFYVYASNAVGAGLESPASNTVDVTRATPVIQWSPASWITYGTPLDAAQLSASATVDDGAVPGTFAFTPAVGAVLPAGDGQTLSLTFTPDDTVRYASVTTTRPIDVKPAPLHVTGTTVQNKTYDGTTAATLAGGTLVGVLAADLGTVTLTQAGTFAQADVGTGIAVTANHTIGGSAAGNYTLTQPTGLSADITPATLTYTATPATMPYGTTPAGLVGTVSGFVPGESQATATTGTLGFTTTATAASAPGQYPVTGGGLDANDGNYIFVQAAGNLVALTIERAAQAALDLVATPDVLIPGMTSQLAASGGSGSGAVGYAVDSGPCSIAGSVATATGAGACVVRATKAGDANYDAATATATIAVQAAAPLQAQAQSVSAVLDTARTIQLAGSDGNIGGPYALTYAIAAAPAHGTIKGLNASTGVLTYTPAADYIGPDDFTFTVASVNGVSPAATVTIAVTAPPLALLIGDGRDYARYGQVVDYVATLTNAGSTAAAMPVTFTLSGGFDRDSLRIDCFVPGGDAQCSQDANDPLKFTVTVQPGRTLTWLAGVRVRADAADDDVTFGVTSAAGALADTNTLVVFRDGFDATGGDGASAPVVDGAPATAVLDGDGLTDVVVPASVGAATTPLLIVRAASREVRIESRSVAGVVLVRLFARGADGRERISAWSAVRPGATLTLGSVAAGASAGNAAPSRVLVLSGGESAIVLP